MTGLTPNGSVGPVVLPVIYYIYLIACCGYVFLRGGKPERFGAILAVTASLLSTALAPTRNFWFEASWALLIIDCATFMAAAVLALKTDRFWPLWFAGFCLVGAVTHVSTAAMPSYTPKAYAWAQAFWGYPAIAAMVMGAWSHHRTRLGNRPSAAY